MYPMMHYGSSAANLGQRMPGRSMMMYSNSAFGWVFAMLWLATWILVIFVLIALVRWLWKKGDKVK